MRIRRRAANRFAEMLESRTHLDAIPYHLQLAEQLVANIAPANNVYAYGTATVTWAGLNGSTTYSNSSDCSTFDTALLKLAYGFTSNQFAQWTGVSSPQAKDLYNAAIADDGFVGFSNVANVMPGDDMFMKYLDSSTDTGHVVTIMAAPTLVSTNATQRVYNLNVLDCTASPHSNDTRVGGQSGVGEGVMRIYTDLSGNLTAYSWGTSSASVVETASTRPATFAKVPAAPQLSTSPIAQSVIVGQDVTFTAAASGSPTPAIQWYVEPFGASNFSAISGSVTQSLDVGAATLAENGCQYKATFTSNVGTVTTVAAKLTVVPAPTITSLIIDDGTAQRSRVRTLTLDFSSAVTLDAGAISLSRVSAGNSIVETFTSTTADGGLTYVLTPTSDLISSGSSLIDGSYRLVVHPSAVHPAAVPSGTMAGSDLTYSFSRLFGDSNGDGTVNLSDYRAFIGSYLQSSGSTRFNAIFDYNNDGTISLTDYRAFLSNYLVTVAS